MSKIGRSTGWRQGQIDLTCFNANVERTNITFICQYRATASQLDGDSGAPVFRITNSPSSGDVALVGIAWGADLAGNTVFSVMGTIIYDSELGSLEVCDAEFSC